MFEEVWRPRGTRRGIWIYRTWCTFTTVFSGCRLCVAPFPDPVSAAVSCRELGARSVWIRRSGQPTKGRVPFGARLPGMIARACLVRHKLALRDIY